MTEESLIRVARAVESRLKRFFDEIEALPIPGPFATPPASLLLDQVRDMTLRGGKRLRSALVVYGASLFDETTARGPAVIEAASALELLHSYFLIHDDIMDGDDIRRGKPSVHAALKKSTGDEHMGTALAILAGDLAAALHQVLLNDLPVERSLRNRVSSLFAKMHLDVVHGQTLDMTGAGSVYEVASRKTASYTTVGPVVAGAMLAGATDAQMDELASMSRPLGIAFQLRDDLIGAFGKPEITGKQVGTDLKRGKRTFLMEEAMRLASDEDRRAIEAVQGADDASEKAIERAREALVRCGAVAACEKRIDELVHGFTDQLTGGEYLREGKEYLSWTARLIGKRVR